MKFSVAVTLKKNVLDPQGKVVEQTLHSMNMKTLKNIRQGKYFEIEINENNENIAKEKINEMCKKLLVNLIIEEFVVTKI